MDKNRIISSVPSICTDCWYGFNKKTEASPSKKKEHAITVSGEYFLLSCSGKTVSVNIPKAQAIPQNNPSGVMERELIFPCVEIRKIPPSARRIHKISTLFGSLLLHIHT